MRLRLIIILVSLLGVQNLFSQDDLKVVSSAGGEATGETMDVNYTIGEPIIEEVDSQEIILSQGFQQVFLNVVASSSISQSISFTYYPNPTVDKVIVDFGEFELNDYKIRLTLADGQILDDVNWNKIDANSASINFSQLAAAIYLVSIMDQENNTIIPEFKVIKYPK